MPDELEILRRLLPGLPAGSGVALGPGDDCAALEISGGKLLLAAVDQLVGGVHYLPESTSPERAGAKLMKRNLSDIAAMGGIPRWALLAVAFEGRSADWVTAFCRGAAAAGTRYGVAVVGGDLARLAGKGEAASLTILGEVAAKEMVCRSGACPGDLVYVTGAIGNSFLSEHHLDFEPRLAEGRFLAANGFATAMLDVSDGLLLDAERLAAASGADITIDAAAVPLRAGAALPGALGDGEDYELLFTVRGEEAERLEREWPKELAPIRRIGFVAAGEGRLRGEYGRKGYEH